MATKHYMGDNVWAVYDAGQITITREKEEDGPDAILEQITMDEDVLVAVVAYATAERGARGA